MRIPARENNDSTVTPPAGGKKVPLTTNRYRPFNVAWVHVVAWSFSSVYRSSTVRSHTLMNTPIPVVHRPIRFLFIWVSSLSRIFGQIVLPLPLGGLKILGRVQIMS